MVGFTPHTLRPRVSSSCTPREHASVSPAQPLRDAAFARRCRRLALRHADDAAMSSLGRELPKELAVALDPDSAELVVSFRPSHVSRATASSRPSTRL